jgi:small subunit ribosomal protein S6
MDELQRQYELIFIISPQLEGADLDKLKDEISGTVTQLGGTIGFKESEKRILAYPINKQGQGIFLITQVLVSPENLANLSKQFKINKQILRHIISQLETRKPKTEKPRIIPKITKPKKAIGFTKPIKEKPAGETELEEIDKKLDEIIGEV